MKGNTKLLLLAAFAILAMTVMVGTAQAAAPFLLDDGSGLKDNGQWEVLDPGACRSNVAQTTRAACNAELFPAFTSQGTCEGTAFCTNPAYTTATDCINNAYVWTFVRKWNVSNCIGNYTSERAYGATANACSNPSYAIITDCTTNGGTWNTINNNMTAYNESSRQDCLHCHNDLYGTHSLASFLNGSSQETYFRTGHKNVLRPVRNLGADVDTAATFGSAMKPLGGPNYTFDPSAGGVAPYTTVNWATGLAGTQQVYYIYNNWFSAVKVNQIEGDPTPDSTSASTVTNVSGARNCFFCHTSAYNLPEARYPLASETIAVSTTNTAANAKFEIGITCVTCHKGAGNNWGDYGVEHHTSTSTNNYDNYPKFEEGTALCSNCHRFEDTAGPITDVAVQDGALDVEELEDHHGNITGQYLQSPHAKFTGTYAQIGDSSMYESNFKLIGAGCSDPEFHSLVTCTTNGGTWATTGAEHNMGCQECHNVHVSSVDPDTRDINNTQSQMNIFCADCHTNAGFAGAPQIVVADINHPTGTSTPLDGLNTNEKVVNMACIRCHMSDRINHLFAINTSAGYSTFNSLCSDTQYETRTTCTGAGQTWSNMSVEFGPINADPQNSVFAELDVNWSCGWCHFDAAKVGAGAVFDKAQMAAGAAGIHGTTTAGDCMACHSPAIVGSGTGKNHHGQYTSPSHGSDIPAACVACHTNAGTNARHDGTTPVGSGMTANAFCTSCHTPAPGPHQLAPGVNHHSLTASAPNCVSCHVPGDATGVNGVTGPGVIPIVVNCVTCHPDKNIATSMAHPFNPSTPQTCEECHTVAGVLPVPTDGCLVCHTGGVPVYSYNLHLAAPNAAPTGCTTNWPPVVNPVGSKTVTHTDASTDAGDPSAMVYVNWGDGSPLEVQALGYAFSKTYASYGTYTITKTVKDGAGASCVAGPTYVSVPAPPPGGGGTATLDIAAALGAGVCSKYPTAITTQAVCTAVGGVWTTPPANFGYTYTLKQGGLTKKTGSGTTASTTTVTGLTAGNYNVYVAYASGHICTFTQGTSVATGGTANLTSCR